MDIPTVNTTAKTIKNKPEFPETDYSQSVVLTTFVKFII